MIHLCSPRRRRNAAGAALACAAAGLLTTMPATASAAAAPDATASHAQRLYVCVARGGGTLSLSDRTTPCPAGQRKISWQVTGMRSEPQPDRRGRRAPDRPSRPRGPAAPRSRRGPAGPQGPVGERGPAGPLGETGAPGAKGETGAQGPGGTGPAGPRGEQGPAGPEGPQGPVGAIGPAGPEGPAGPSGPIGLTGAPGATGARGPAGDPSALAADSGWVSDTSGATIGITQAIALTGPENLGPGLDHPPGSKSVTVGSRGRYLVSFNVNVIATSGAGASVALAVNNAGVDGASIPVAGSAGNVSGEIILPLDAGDRLSLFNSGSPSLTLGQLYDVGASLTIQRLA